MATFDSWEVAVRPPEDYLMHFRTKGSKNGVRRFQREDGTWTELGLEERREREGWGDGGDSKAVRKAEKRVAKAERKVQRAEATRARKEARAQRKFERAEKRRKRSLSGLTDEEMRQKLARAKMEAEYRDLTKRTGLIESGAKLVSSYLQYKDKKEERALESSRQKLELEKTKTERIKSIEQTKQNKARIGITKYEANKAKEEAKKQEQLTEEARINRKKNLLDAKREYKNYTIRGGIARAINIGLTAGKAKKLEAIRKAEGETESNRIKSDAARDLKNRRAEQSRQDDAAARRQAERDLAPQRRREEQLRRERQKANKQYNREMERLQRQQEEQQRRRQQEADNRERQRREQETARRVEEAKKWAAVNEREERLRREREKARRQYQKEQERLRRKFG